MLPAWLPDSVTADLDRAVHYTLLWGLEGLVLRTVGGVGDRVPFVNEARLKRRLAEAELPVVAVDPGLFEAPASERRAWLNDLAAFPETAGFCRRVGCPLVLVGALAEEGVPPEAAAAVLRQAGDEAARAGLRLAVWNDAATACASGERLAALLSAVAHPAVGAAWSPADALLADADPAAGLEAIRQAAVPVLTVGVRDLEADSEGAWRDVAPGEGVVGWAAHLAALGASGFGGPLVLDVRRKPAGAFGLQAATALIRLAREARVRR